jgi:hypothetical protein
MALRIKIGDLIDGLKSIRVLAFARGGKPCVYPWEEIILKRLNMGKIKLSDEYPLHDFFPAAVLDGDSVPRLLGGRHGFGKSDNSIPPLHFAVRINQVSHEETYKSAFLMHDALNTHAERRRLTEALQRISATSLVHLFESPFSPNFRKLVKQGVKSWRIRPSDFPVDGELFLDDAEVLGMMDVKPKIHTLPSLLSEKDQKALYNNFGQLRKSARSDTNVTDAYRKLYNLYRFILTLPVPIDDYDAMAFDFGYSTVKERLEDIKEDIPSIGPVDYSYFDDSLQKIQNMENRLREDPVRSRAILTEVKRAQSSEQRVGVVISNELYGSALQRYLARALNTDPMLLTTVGVRIIPFGSLRTIRPEEKFDVLIFPSYRGGNTLRWVMSGKSRESVVICTEGERRAMLRDFREGTESRNTWAPNRNEPEMPLEDNPEDKLAKALSNVPPDLPTIPLDDEKFVQDLLDHLPSRGKGLVKMAGPLKCLKVIFRERYAFLPVEGVVTVIGKKGTVEKAVKDLDAGEIVLFVNHGQSRTIYDLMLDEIKRSSEFEAYVAIIQQWHRILYSWFVNSEYTYIDLHHILSDKGSRVIGATVASWIRGNTMAPLDPQNLARLISLVGISDTEGKVCIMVNDAAVRLRTVYRVYARAVNSFLMKAASSDRAEMDDLLEKYNLDIGMIRDSVVKEEVEKVLKETVNVSPSFAGRLYEN